MQLYSPDPPCFDRSHKVTGICIPIETKEILLAAVYELPGRTWSEADVIGLLNFMNKSLLTGDLNANNPVWNSRVSNLLRMRLLDLQDKDFQISAPQRPTHYTPQGNGDVLDIVAHRNVRLSDITVSDILDSDHVPVLFHILDYVSARNILAPVEIHTDWELFRSVASDLISPRIQIDTADDTERAACNFAASVASTYRLSSRKITLSELNNELPEIDRLLQVKRRL